MSITLQQILALTGKLDDTPGLDTPRERFRRFLKDNVTHVGEVRDYIEACLRASGDQYSRALQDLVNHLGRFLGFTVTFGRYQGVRGQVGFDGHWHSPSGFHIVIEVKSSETYAIRTATLTGYIDALISERQIADWDHALGLYVIGRPNAEIRQLDHAITAERRTHQLRLIAVESLLSLAELMNEYDVSHSDILAVLRPSGPTIDAVVVLMTRLVAQRQTVEPTPGTVIVQSQEEGRAEPAVLPSPLIPMSLPSQAPRPVDGVTYWLTPVKSDEDETAEAVIQTLVGEAGIYAFGERTPGRKRMQPGDWLCFYATGTGVIAHAQVQACPEHTPHPRVRHAEQYPWVCRLHHPRLYLDAPVVIDAALRSQLEAFRSRAPGKSWAWFVQATRRVSAHDFDLLTRRDLQA
jgi:hypothetical protein